uniref:Uncharacterized protein n=1 Tax=Nelumbo nucifera TaxID=4432 RepID=A0A822Y6K0_NELNU|nr:TPA_asm: hypothetical protein HUJ06_028264 [Nelumbo nucifera]
MKCINRWQQEDSSEKDEEEEVAGTVFSLFLPGLN